MEVLKQRAIRGGFAKLIGQGATFALRLLYIIVVARLLTPSEFGIVAMVTAVTGVYDLFRDGGLSAGLSKGTAPSAARHGSVLRHHQSVGVADDVDRPAATEPECCAGAGPAVHCVLPRRTALRSERRRPGLFDGDDAVAHPAYGLVSQGDGHLAGRTVPADLAAAGLHGRRHGVAYAAQMLVGHSQSAIARLTLDTGVMAAVYGAMLLVVMGQKRFYFDLVSQLKTPR
jgi:hypothetical protein